MTLEPIFPYFGGKRRAAEQVWESLGRVDRYIEPFFGSGAVLLGNPYPAKSELINDINHHVANLWRALQHEPEKVWQLASAPCSEIELKARAKWLKEWVPYDFSDMGAYDAYAAGVWLWVVCVTILPDGEGLHRGDHGKGIKGYDFNRAWFDAVCDRMARVQVLCGDWSRCVTDSSMYLSRCITGVFFDPPYGVGNVHYDDNSGTAAKEVWEWAIKNGNNPRLRIVVAGYDDGRELPKGWTVIERTEKGGYGLRNAENKNRHTERLWCSPHCQRNQPSLFE
jgi:DNA adenine methylase